MDCTGSMEQWIQASKDHITTIVEETQTQYPDADFETAFVGYRDYGDEERFITVDFMNPHEMLNRIAHVHADGGNDSAEDVAGGLRRVFDLEWSCSTLRIVIHIADAPAHGNMFHDRLLSDRYPAGDPDGYDPLYYIGELADREIGYTFVKINKTTDKMITAFAERWHGLADFKVLDLTPQGIAPPPSPALWAPPPPVSLDRMFSHAITMSITESISRNTASQDPAEV